MFKVYIADKNFAKQTLYNSIEKYFLHVSPVTQQSLKLLKMPKLHYFFPSLILSEAYTFELQVPL